MRSKYPRFIFELCCKMSSQSSYSKNCVEKFTALPYVWSVKGFLSKTVVYSDFNTYLFQFCIKINKIDPTIYKKVIGVDNPQLNIGI